MQSKQKVAPVNADSTAAANPHRSVSNLDVETDQEAAAKSVSQAPSPGKIPGADKPSAEGTERVEGHRRTEAAPAEMFKVPFLASTWKRIHYDHHQDPNRLEILFGALHTTLPTIALATAPIGYLIGGTGAALAAFATGLITTCVYEFFHCIQHLAYKPKRKWVMEMKARHMAHHFHDERGNYGITNYFWDKLFHTYYERIDKDKKSETVFNLGYTPEVAERYPWVARLSGGVATGHPSQRIPH